MEIPCKLILRGTVDELQKVMKYFRDALEINVCIRKTDENSIVTPAHTVCKSVATMDASTAMNMAALTPPVKCPLDSSEELPPEKHVNCINISSSPLKHNTANSTKIWVQFQRNVLTMTAKEVIEDGHRLTDRHINFAQRLISSQFPYIGVLQAILFQHRYYCFPHQSMQAIFCRRREH